MWEIIRTLAAQGTTVLLTTQYLDEADQLAGRIAVVDHGKVIAEGTPAELKASVGSRAVHVRLMRPDCRERARELLATALAAPVHLEADPAALSARVSEPERVPAAMAELERADIPVAEFALGQPSLDEVFLALTGRPAEDQTEDGDERARGGGSMTTEATTGQTAAPTELDASLLAVLSAGERPDRPSAVSAALTFGWRGLLKIKHVPEQLFDVTLTPILFTLMFTFIWGGAIEGSTGEYLQYILPGILVVTVVFTTVYSGVTMNTDITKGVVDRFRSLPISRSAPLVGPLLADCARYVLAALVGLAVG